MQDTPYRVISEPLDERLARAAVAGAAAGAVTVFTGTVRNHNAGHRVLWIDYEAYAPLAVKTFERIGDEVRERWPDVRLAIHHRTGRVEIGDASVVIAAASAHRADAFAVCRYAIERVKQIAPIWKHEHLEDGAVWVEGATADPDDRGAVDTALQRTCT